MPEYLAPGVYTEEVSFRPKSIEGVGTSTTAFVGPTRKGPLSGTPEVITSFGEFVRLFGGIADLNFSGVTDVQYQRTNYTAHAVLNFFNEGGSRLYVARVYIPVDEATDGIAHSQTLAGGALQFFARVPGSGLNGIINVFEKRIPATQKTLEAAPDGSFVRIGGASTVVAAMLAGSAPPFRLNNGDALVLTLPGGDITATVQGTPVQHMGQDIGAGPIDIPADTTFSLTAGGVEQTITLPTGSQSLAEIVAFLNANLHYVAVSLNGQQLQIATDARGIGASLQIPQNDLLGFTAPFSDNGTGNVQDLDFVTVSELDALLQAANPNVRASTVSGLLSISSTVGNPPTIIATNTAEAVRFALGIAENGTAGSSGVTPTFFTKTNGSWGGLDVNGADPSTTEIVTFNLEARDADGTSMLFEDLGFAPAHPRYIGAVLTQNPSRKSDALANPYYLRIQGDVTGQQIYDALFAGSSENQFEMINGNDGQLPVNNGDASNGDGYLQGLQRLEDVQDISIIAAPGHSAYTDYQAIQGQLISHAENMTFWIAVLDTQPGLTPGAAREARSRIDSTYAAMYYPWVVVSNPLAQPDNQQIPREIPLPPSGFVTGIYARSDNTTGVWKAPANEVVRGALRFEIDINHRVQEVLNPEGINCLRYFYGRGNRVWGARTASSDPEWKYVNIRRYFIYLRASIDRSTQWAVFMPNGEALWQNIRETIEAFLYTEWRSGALLGTTPEEAYFVRCDRSTMTQNDLDNGRLICEIGVAVVKPAEFVIFRIGQKTADARN